GAAGAGGAAGRAGGALPRPRRARRARERARTARRRRRGGRMRACVLIPDYDHRDEIEGVVDSLAFAGLPCLIVDDGSGPATRAVLDEIARSRPGVDVHRRARNGGRRAAPETRFPRPPPPRPSPPSAP